MKILLLTLLALAHAKPTLEKAGNCHFEFVGAASTDMPVGSLITQKDERYLYLQFDNGGKERNGLASVLYRRFPTSSNLACRNVKSCKNGKQTTVCQAQMDRRTGRFVAPKSRPLVHERLPGGASLSGATIKAHTDQMLYNSLPFSPLLNGSLSTKTGRDLSCSHEVTPGGNEDVCQFNTHAFEGRPADAPRHQLYRGTGPQ